MSNNCLIGSTFRWVCKNECTVNSVSTTKTIDFIQTLMFLVSLQDKMQGKCDLHD